MVEAEFPACAKGTDRLYESAANKTMTCKLRFLHFAGRAMDFRNPT